MGFPTANLLLEKSEKILPPDGVYACYADTPKGSFKAMVNVGVRPTFSGAGHLLEANLFGFNDDLYHRIIRVRFVKRIRKEQKFPDMSRLVSQIKKDQKAVADILKDPEENLNPESKIEKFSRIC
jgi:riboflavin kinase/FMN adenylyltransferase